MYNSHRYDPTRRRRRPHSHPSPFSTVATVATAAALAYGVYRLGSYVWNSYRDDESESEDGDDVLYEWSDKSRGRNINGDEPRSNYRSRRSRGDWSEMNHRRRSHRPSPGEGYVHHDGDGMDKSIPEEVDDRVDIPPIVRNSRMARCRTETSRAMMDFLPTLKNAVAKQTDVSLETEELKRLRVQRRERSNGDDTRQEERIRERELWNSIKKKSVTRLVTTVYAHTIVFLVLTVQVNLLGGRLLRDEGGDEASLGEDSLGSDRYRSSHQMVLAKTYEHIFAKGIPSLEAAVSNIVERIVEDWDVLGSVGDETSIAKKDFVSMHDVSFWIDQIRDEIESRSQKGMSSASALAQFIIPEENEVENNQDGIGSDDIPDELARYILDETYDLLESPTFANSERTCLDATFSHLQSDGYAKLFTPQIENVQNGDAQTVPLAAAITHLQKTAVSTFYKPPSRKDEIESWGGVFGMMEEPLPSEANVYIPILERLDAVLELGSVCFD